MSTDPTIATVDEYSDTLDEHFVVDNRVHGADGIHRNVPARYADAVADVDGVTTWVRTLVEQAVTNRRGITAAVVNGPSLLLIGPTGTGKTHQAYGALRAFAASGAQVRWRMLAAADLYAHLRPRSGVDTEAEYMSIASVPLLVLDDLGAAKPSEWTEEITYRLVNHRYAHELPTLLTTNVPPKDLAATLGDRVASRLAEMADRCVLHGNDRRRETAR